MDISSETFNIDNLQPENILYRPNTVVNKDGFKG